MVFLPRLVFTSRPSVQRASTSTEALRREWFVSMAAACAAWLTASGASAEVVTLAALEQRAMETHGRLSAGALRVRAADAEVRQAQSAFRPRVGLSVDANAAPGLALQELGDGFYVQSLRSLEAGSRRWEAVMPRPRVSAGVRVDAYLSDFGRTQAAVQAGEARRRAAEADRDLEGAQVVAAVRGAYLDWLSAHQCMRSPRTPATTRSGARSGSGR